MYRIQNKKKGITLIEVLHYIIFSGIIGITILTTFIAGLKAISKGQSYFGPKTDILIALERMERDLRNTFHWTGIDFIGSRNQ